MINRPIPVTNMPIPTKVPKAHSESDGHCLNNISPRTNVASASSKIQSDASDRHPLIYTAKSIPPSARKKMPRINVRVVKQTSGLVKRYIPRTKYKMDKELP